MAASKAQKEQAARLLATGKTEGEAAEAVGVSRSSIQGWKRKKDFQSLISSHRITSHVAKAEVSADIADSQRIILEQLIALREDELAINKDARSLYEKLLEKTRALIDLHEAEDYSPRQVVSLLSSTVELMKFRLMLSDRAVGIEALVDAYR